MNAPRLLIGLLVLAVPVAVVFLLRTEPTAIQGAAAGPRALAHPTGSSPSDLAAPGDGGSTLPSRSERTEPARSAAGLENAAGRTLRVQVLMPPGAPQDPDLEVVALAASHVEADAPDEVLQRLRAEGDPSSGIVRARVDADGTAELRLPADLGEAVALVDGRFLFQPRARPIPTDVGELSLEPALGGLIEVSLLATAGARPPSALQGELRMTGGNWGGGGGGRWHRRNLPVQAEPLEFRAVDPGLTWSLAPTLDQHHADTQIGLQVKPGAVLQLDVDVSPGATVSGRAVDDRGEPIEGVTVRVKAAMPWMGGAERRTETEGDGTFVLRGIAPGNVVLEGLSSGWRTVELEPMELADGEERGGVELVLTRGLTIAGTVRLSDGTPVAGADVVVERLERQNRGGWGGAQLREFGRAQTRAEGRFAISGLSEGAFTVRAALESEGTGSTARAALEGVLAGGADIVLDLRDPIAFSGRVVDDLEEPVTAFRITAESIDAGGPEEEQSYRDDDGRFHFDRVGPGTWTLRVEAEGHVQVGRVEHVLPDAGEDVVLAMQRTARISGRVVDAAGQPVARAAVTGDDGAERGFGGWGGPAGPEASADANGLFALEKITPGTLVVTARADGWADSSPVTFSLAPGEVREDVLLTLRVGGRIEGQVVTPEGDPLAGRRVIWGESAMGFGARGDTVADSSGRFGFDHVTPGEWAVSAVPSMEELRDGMRSGDPSSFVDIMGDLVTKTVAVADGETVEVFLGGEPRQPVRIFGVVSRAGEALAGADVYAVSEGSAVFEGMKATRSAADGSYELVIDRPGPHTFSANVDGVGVEEVLDVPRQDELRVDLAIPLGRIEGRVRESDGSPAKGIRMALERNDGLGRIRWAGGQATTDDAGNYVFEDLQAGTYTVRANVEGWGGSVNERFGAAVTDAVEVLEDRTTSGVDLELEAAGTATGVVLGEGGTPLAGASLYFRDEAGRLVSSFSSVLSDASGRFEKGGLAPGRYTLSARAEGWAAGDDVSVRIESGQVTDVRVQLEPATYVLVRLEDENGQARRARVQVLDQDGNDVAGLITMNAMRAAFNEGAAGEEQRVGPIPPGRYTVRATTAGGEVKERRVRLRAKESEKRVVLSLD